MIRAVWHLRPALNVPDDGLVQENSHLSSNLVWNVPLADLPYGSQVLMRYYVSYSSITPKFNSLPNVTQPEPSATVSVVQPVVTQVMRSQISVNPQVAVPSPSAPSLPVVSPKVGSSLSEADYLPFQFPNVPVPRSVPLNGGAAGSCILCPGLLSIPIPYVRPGNCASV